MRLAVVRIEHQGGFGRRHGFSRTSLAGEDTCEFGMHVRRSRHQGQGASQRGYRTGEIAALLELTALQEEIVRLGHR